VKELDEAMSRLHQHENEDYEQRPAMRPSVAAA
jgi:hypothetical protein